MHNMQIVNPIFFVRCMEPRDPDLDLLRTMDKQLDLVNCYGFPATFLLQYDSLIRDEYVDRIKQKLAANSEVGGWFEIVQPLVEKAGIPWRGREGFAWDWHSDVGFSVGYTPDERRLLVDIFMDEFRQRFGYYPRSVGSWVIDAVSLAYMADQYGIEASCNCRDQWGTDGYTLWGGYYGQGYYPSRYNMFCPAQTLENQIPVPTFRMLGSDPIYQYDIGLFDSNGQMNPSENQKVITLEPVYSDAGGGGNPAWVDWYFKENFAPGAAFGYTQVGQENSFGWELMKEGLQYQFSVMDRLNKEGRLQIWTLRDTGRWYKKNYARTASTSISGMTDWQNKNRKSLWYDSCNYRVNIYEDNGCVWIRDIHKFDERYPERYLTEVCESHLMMYDNLPLIDGNRWSRNNIRAGLYFSVLTADKQMEPLKGKMQAAYPSAGNAEITVTDGTRVLRILCMEDCMRFTLEAPEEENLILDFRDGAGALEGTCIDGDYIRYKHNQYPYSLRVAGVSIQKSPNGIRLISQKPIIEFLY